MVNLAAPRGARFDREARQIKHAGNKLKLLASMDVAAIDVDHAIAVEEQRALLE